MRRKALVDTAIAAQRAEQGTWPQEDLLPPLEPTPPEPRMPANTIEARLISAVSGEVYMTVQMFTWSLIGDTICKANSEFARQRKSQSVTGPHDPNNSHEENLK